MKGTTAVADMDVLEFVAAMTAALAWPVIALVAVILLRSQLAAVLTGGRLKRLKAGGVELEMEFDEGLENARAVLQPEPGVEPLTPTAEADEASLPFADTFRDEMAAIAAVDPSAAVVASFTRLERVVRAKLDLIHTDYPRGRMTSRSLGEEAVKQGVWTRREQAAYLDLIPLRNIAAHGEAVNLDESRALEFAEIALQLMIALALGLGETYTTDD